MRNLEEFKALIAKKQETFLQERRQKRKKFLFMAPAACLVIGILFTVPTLSRFSDKATGNETTAALQSTITETTQLHVLSVDVTTWPVSEKLQRHYTNPEKTKAILSYLEALTLSDTNDNAADAMSGLVYTITVIRSDGAIDTYLHSANQYLCVNGGEWKKMCYEEASALQVLLENLPSDLNTICPTT